MKRVNFREVNKKFSQLKQAENKAKMEYLLTELGSDAEALYYHKLEISRKALQAFRNKKISELF